MVHSPRSMFYTDRNKTKLMNYSSQNLKAISFALYPSASVPSNWLVPRVLSNSSARIERDGRLVEEDLRNEVGAKYTFLNWPGAPNDNFRKNVCSEDDFRSRIFGAFFVKFLACLPLLGFSNV